MTQDRKYFSFPDEEIIGSCFYIDFSKDYRLKCTLRHNDVSVILYKNNYMVLDTPFHGKTASLNFEKAKEVNTFIDWIYDNLIGKQEGKVKPEQDYIETAGVFWLVWTPQGGNPKYRHSTRESAETEAERLANREPEKEFYVLKTVSKVNVEHRIHKVNFE